MGKMEPQEEDVKGWVPTGEKILRQNVDLYLKGDQDLTELDDKIAYLEEVMEFLKAVMSQINQRGFQISNAIKWQQFTHGSDF